MAELIHLHPQDPLPERAGAVLVMRQFGEDDPRARVVTVEVVGESTRTVLDGDDDAALDRGVATAQALAGQRGVERIHVLDRTASVLAQATVAHQGDRTTRTDDVSDFDPEDGVRGTDIRDREPS